MKVALLTHHWVPNFGANLQSVSSTSLLRRLGHELTVLNYRPKGLETSYQTLIPPGQIAMHDAHCRSFLPQSPVLRSEDDLLAYCRSQQFDVIIAGSDSLFRVKRTVRTEEGSFPNPFWLLWTKSLRQEGKPRIAFLAPSCEGSYFRRWDPLVIDGARDAIMQCDAISVRDRWTQKMVRYVTRDQLQPEICPDPVSVLNHSLSIPDDLLGDGARMKKKYILLHTNPKYLTPKWCKRFTELAHADGLQVFTLPSPARSTTLPVDGILKLPMHPLTWYSWIKNAAGIVSVNFHPIACAVFNGVPFISIDVSGPIHCHCFARREASKTYDLCMSVSAEAYSFLPVYVRFLLSPDRAYRLLRDFDCRELRAYSDQSNRRFLDEMQRCIGGSGTVADERETRAASSHP